MNPPFAITYAVLALITLSVLCNAEFNPYEVGPYNETLTFHWHFNETDLYKNVEVYAPKNATGSFPVIFFSHSFAGTITVKSVEQFLHRIASYGYTIIAPWRQISANYTVDWIDPTIDYAEENAQLSIVDAGGNPEYLPDFSKMFIMGHSAGNHIAVNYLKRKGCRDFLAAVHLSPVDGTDPFGIIQTEFCITPGQLLNYNLPSLIVMAGLDPIPGAPLFPACAPEKLSNLRYYEAMPGNRWFVNATAYGHADFFEPGFIGAIEFLSFCASDEDTDKDFYRDFVAGTAVAFMEAFINPDENCEMLQYVENPLNTNVDTIMENDVDPLTRCQAKCTWEPEPEPSSTTTENSMH